MPAPPHPAPPDPPPGADPPPPGTGGPAEADRSGQGVVALDPPPTRPSTGRGSESDRSAGSSGQGAATWLALGAVVGALAVLDSVGGLLQAVEGANSRAYGTGVFTGFRLAFWDSTDLAAALALWRADDAIDLRWLIGWHVLADLALIAAYATLAHRVLRAVGASTRFRDRWVRAVVAADVAETVVLFAIVTGGTGWRPWLVLVRTLSTAKWVAASVLVVGVVVAWWRDDGVQRAGRFRAGASLDAWRGRKEVPAPLALTGQISLVATFALLIALPAGGPLEQVPDVLRYQLSGAPKVTKVLSVLALGVLALAVAASSRIGTPQPPADRPRRGGPELPDSRVVGAAAVASLALVVTAVATGQPVVAPMAAPLVVALAVTAAGTIAERALHPDPVGPPRRSPPSTAAAGLGGGPGQHALPQVEVDEGRSEQPTGGWGWRWRLADHDHRAHLEVDGDGVARQLEVAARQDRWGAALAGVVVVAGGVGLIRATVPFLLLRDGDARWGAGFVVALATVLAGGLAVQATLLAVAARTAEPDRPAGRWTDPAVRWAARAVCLVAVGACGVLAVSPGAGRLVGTTGAFALAFAGYLALIGGLQHVSHRTAPWSATRRLGLGDRTPWLSLLVVTWVVASVLHTTTGYHRVRTDLAGPPVGQRHPSVVDAFTAWAAANLEDAPPQGGGTAGSDCRVDGTVPLVLVAAPGGGVRAAHWTAGALDRLFAPPCRHRLFAVSGASGGSVGATAWLAAATTGHRPADAIDGLRRDDALAATVAALLLRDLPQPLTGFRSAWDDRAAVLEDRWIASTVDDGGGPFGTLDEPLGWDALYPDGTGWRPALVLAASSVTDGCRALIATIAGLPASDGADCLMPTRPVGPSRAAIDPLRMAAACDGSEPPRMRAVSAALLSARFPYITPSGAVRHCLGDVERDLYLVDGGYFENSGILAALELWGALEPLVDDHNRRPEVEAGVRPRIEPWVLVVDNHYRSRAAGRPPSRPLELLVPLRTALSSQVDGQAALEQQARIATARFAEGGCANSGRIGPAVRPGLAAPLGWVLSDETSAGLDADLEDQLTALRDATADDDPGGCLAPLLRALVPDGDPQPG